ncbi:hypothetical protein [Ottowia thiooxydans]|uniref:DUF4124 domain-containing protein n=1 Tax=Ottowia thiooxydans TaxID=219182 RepID=A0ABV2QD27_9BURK
MAMALLFLASEPAVAQVYRCGSSYQALPCAGGHERVQVIKVTQVDSPAQVASTGSSAMYLCKRYSGRRFWTSRPCSQHKAAMLERQVRVPVGLKWKEKLAYAIREHRNAEALQTTPTLTAKSTRPSQVQK